MQSAAVSYASPDPNVQLRALYTDLLHNQGHFEEFRNLLALYHPHGVGPDGRESPSTHDVRRRLNERIRSWLAVATEELTSEQVLQWRAIVVEERFGAGSPTPWSGLGVL